MQQAHYETQAMSTRSSYLVMFNLLSLHERGSSHVGQALKPRPDPVDQVKLQLP
jgi:hypothetical protein